MPVTLPINSERVPRRSGIAKIVLLTLGYLLVAAVLVGLLENGMFPPGYTGCGTYAMAVILAGAFHLAGKCKSPSVFLLFGGFGALLPLAAFIASLRGSGVSNEDKVPLLVSWMLFVVAVSLATRMVAKVRWRSEQVLPREGPLCLRCGYDLRATKLACPECGRAFDPQDPASYLGTVRHWSFRWLMPRVAILLVASVTLAIAYVYLYWRSQAPEIAAITEWGAFVESENSLPRFFVPTGTSLADLEKPFARAVGVAWRGQTLRDEQLKHLTSLPDVAELNIQDAPAITDAGIACLNQLRNLEDVYLDGTAVSDSGLLDLAGLPKLKIIDVANTHVTPEGVRKFRALRPDVSITGP